MPKQSHRLITVPKLETQRPSKHASKMNAASNQLLPSLRAHAEDSDNYASYPHGDARVETQLAERSKQD